MLPRRTWREIARFLQGHESRPPDLKDVASSEPAELYWVIKNGVKMTGMPVLRLAWKTTKSGRVVAFIRKLPVSDADFKTWTAGLKERLTAALGAVPIARA